MDTRLYDSSEPGPPSGWLWLGKPYEEAENCAWDDVATTAGAALDLDGSRLKGNPGEVYWGALNLHGRCWIYRILPAGKDRLGRPGRYLIAIFTAATLEELDWRAISLLQDELSILIADPSHLSIITSHLRDPRLKSSLMDELFRSLPSDRMRPIQDRLSAALESLPAGGRVFFAIDTHTGSVLRRRDSSDDASTNHGVQPPDAASAPSLQSEKQKPSVPARRLQAPASLHYNNDMKIGLLVVSLLCSLIVGWYVGANVWSGKAEIEQPVGFRDAAHAISEIERATAYLRNHYFPNDTTPSSAAPSEPLRLNPARDDEPLRQR